MNLGCIVGLTVAFCDGQHVVGSRRAAVLSTFSCTVIKQLGCVCLCLFLLVVPTYGQSDSELNLKGAFDFHVHQAPDSSERVIDADDLARLAKESGMRGLIMKNHF